MRIKAINFERFPATNMPNMEILNYSIDPLEAEKRVTSQAVVPHQPLVVGGCRLRSLSH